MLAIVYDSWGREVSRHQVSAEASSATVQLAQRPGLYVCALVVEGVVVAKERVLIER